MIIKIDKENAYLYRKQLDDMFKDRCETFTNRLKWVPSMNDREVDQFDTIMAEPTYLVSVDKNSFEYRGSIRILKTTGMNMIRNVFDYLISKDEIPYDPSVLELSRFTVDDKNHKGILSVTLGELLVGLRMYTNMLSCFTNLSYSYVACIDDRIYRILKIAGLKFTTIGKPYLHHDEDGDHYAYVGNFDLSWDNVKKVKDVFGFETVPTNF